MSLLLAIIPGLPITQTHLIYGGAGVGVVFVLFVVVMMRSKPTHDPDAGLDEVLASLPAPPGGERNHVLKVMGHPVRVRLVVVAPTGKKLRFTSCDIFRVAGGKIAEHWGMGDIAGVMAQLKG